MMSVKPFLSIVIPAYNEEKNISVTLSEIAEYLKDKGLGIEVIMVDDGSSDATVQKASEFENKFYNFRIIKSSPNRGKGYVVKKGVLEAKGEYILFMDADNSTSIKELDKFLPFFDEGYDIYIASRRIPGARVRVPLKRKLMGNMYIFLSRMILGIRASDLNCGFKIFKNEAAKSVFSRQVMDDWSFDAEVLYIAQKKGYSVKEVPVEWDYKATSKVKPFKDGVESLHSLVHVKRNDLKGIYD